MILGYGGGGGDGRLDPPRRQPPRPSPSGRVLLGLAIAPPLMMAMIAPGYAVSANTRSRTAMSGTAMSGTAMSDTARSDTAMSDTARSDTAMSDTARSDTARSDTATSGLSPGPAGWITTADGSRRVSALSPAELRPSGAPSAIHIEVDPTLRFQQMDGFGAALTESAAHLLMGLSPPARTAALTSLFGPSGAGIDMIRIPLGSSDFALSRYTYDDVPTGLSDPGLRHFSVSHDDAEILPILRSALRLNPRLQVMGTPWSAPAWMKTGRSLIGGTLAPERIAVYARYLVRAVQAMHARGVPLHFLTLQNEPQNSPADYPGMILSAAQEAALAVAVRAGLDAAALKSVQVIGYDHNWGTPGYPAALLADPGARRALAGTAWHCYTGQPSAQKAFHDLHPDKGIWLTECTGGGWSPDFGDNLGWNASTLLVGATRAWARSVLLWNLALDPRGGPHTGGCTNCRGVLTINPATGAVTRNVEYDVLALAGRAVQVGAVRIESSTDVYGVQTVAYLNPDGTHVLTAYNGWRTGQTVVISQGARTIGTPLPAGAVATITW